MSPDAGLRVRAQAKLTLTLRVLGTRPDGFHELEALTTSLAAPADELDVARRAEPGVGLVLAGTPADVPADATNLVVRAVERLVAAGHVPTGWSVHLRKAIPAGGGLGGGSADAAAVLRAVQRLAGGPDDAVLLAAAAALGSDVPFCLTGGLAWMRGRGERIEPASPAAGVAPAWVVTATPSLAVSTPAVYRRWDELGGPTSGRALPAPAAVAHLVPALANDLEPAAESLEPRLATFRAAVERATGLAALLAGSGASYVLAVDDEATARAAAGALRAAEPSATVHVGPFAPAGWTVAP